MSYPEIQSRHLPQEPLPVPKEEEEGQERARADEHAGQAKASGGGCFSWGCLFCSLIPITIVVVCFIIIPMFSPYKQIYMELWRRHPSIVLNKCFAWLGYLGLVLCLATPFFACIGLPSGLIKPLHKQMPILSVVFVAAHVLYSVAVPSSFFWRGMKVPGTEMLSVQGEAAIACGVAAVISLISLLFVYSTYCYTPASKANAANAQGEVQEMSTSTQSISGFICLLLALGFSTMHILLVSSDIIMSDNGN